MTIRNSWPGPTAVTTQTDARIDLAALIVRDLSGTPRGGIFPRHTNALVTARSDMKVDVAAFDGASIRGGGPLFQGNDGTVQVVIATAPGSNSRLDVVYFKQDENASPYSDADALPVLASQAGVAAASPLLSDTLALLPAGAEPIASVLVPAGKTATNQSGVVITPIFRYTTVHGGLIWVRSAADLAVTSGYAAMNNYAVDQRARDISTGIIYRWNGTTWRPWESDWISFTPTLTGVAIGTGGAAANTASYRYETGRVRVRGVATLGTSGSSVSGTVVVTLPVTATALRHPYQRYDGEATFYDVSAVQNFDAGDTANNASVTDFNILSFYGANGLRAGTGASTPFIWAAGDSISYDFTYDPA